VAALQGITRSDYQTVSTVAISGTDAELILASASPRRQALLAALGVTFRCIFTNIDESAAPGESPAAMACRLSLAKAQAVARAFPQATVIGADTIVVLDDMILGKPLTAEEAVAMLRMLRARVHEVLSAVTLCQGERLSLQRLSRSRVWMRAYSDEEIAAYVASSDPLDKAGAYAIQHPWFRPVVRWEGCYASVMGLPLADVAALLRQAGWEVPIPVTQACRSEIETTCCQEKETSSNPEFAT